MSIDAFKAAINIANTVRPNQFKMTITGLGETFSYLCRAATIPSHTIEEIIVPYRGRQIFIPGDPTMEPLVMTVMGDMSLRSTIESWAESVAPKAEASYGLPSVVKQQGNLLVYSNDQDTELAEYAFIGLWPTTVGEMALDMETTSEFSTFELTMRYESWYRVK